MKILVTGANGLLGQYLVRRLVELGHQVEAMGKGACRLTNGPYGSVGYHEADLVNTTSQTWETITRLAPDAVVHAAAMTQVDQCELERDLCYATNVSATANLVRIAAECRSHFVYLSSDFVFDGLRGGYDEEDRLASVNWYGSTKILAEELVEKSNIPFAIVRTCLVYGARKDGSRHNIVSWVKEKLENDQIIRVVDDQVRTPTYAADLAHGISLVLEKRAQGIFHLAGKDILTPFDMAIKTAEILGLDKNLIQRVNATTFTQPAARPLRTGLLIDKARRLLGYEPLTFDQGLRKMLTD
jgi:dTDP-4-dehydrorhamnose reductase